jgi:hypothetical protein
MYSMTIPCTACTLQLCADIKFESFGWNTKTLDILKTPHHWLHAKQQCNRLKKNKKKWLTWSAKMCPAVGIRHSYSARDGVGDGGLLHRGAPLPSGFQQGKWVHHGSKTRGRRKGGWPHPHPIRVRGRLGGHGSSKLWRAVVYGVQPFCQDIFPALDLIGAAPIVVQFKSLELESAKLLVDVWVFVEDGVLEGFEGQVRLSAQLPLQVVHFGCYICGLPASEEHAESSVPGTCHFLVLKIHNLVVCCGMDFGSRSGLG